MGPSLVSSIGKFLKQLAMSTNKKHIKYILKLKLRILTM